MSSKKNNKKQEAESITLKDAQDLKTLLDKGSLKNGILALNECNPRLAKTMLDAVGLQIKPNYMKILKSAINKTIILICLNCFMIAILQSFLISLWFMVAQQNIQLSSGILAIYFLAFVGLMYICAITYSYIFNCDKK